MKRTPINRQYALAVATTLRQRLAERQIPVRGVFIFGSATRNEANHWSDIDIAIVCDPFLKTKFDEQIVFSREARTIDIRAEVVCLHPQDLENAYFTLAQEVQRKGIAV